MQLFIVSLPRLIHNANMDMRRHFSMTLSSIISIAIALFLSMLMAVAALNLDRIAGSIEDQLQLQVAVSPGLDQEQIALLQREIENTDGVESVTFSTRDEELQKLIDESGSTFSQYRDSNPLYDVFIVTINPIDTLASVSADLAGLDGVVSADYGGSTITTLVKLFSSIRFIGYAAVAALVLLGVFLIRNTVRMAIEMRQNEISIMRTVGAYNFFISMPFIIEGMVMGFWGALIPAVLVDAGYILFYKAFHGALISAIFSLYPPVPFLLWLTAADLALGLILGAFGSRMAVRRSIRRVR